MFADLRSVNVPEIVGKNAKLYFLFVEQEGTDAAMVQQNLNLSNTGNLILTDLGRQYIM